MEITRVVSAALHNVIFYRRRLAKALAIPFAIYLLLDVFSYLNDSVFGAALLWVLYTGVYAVFAITTHRILLLGEDSVSEWGLRAWTARETSFALHLIGISLLFFPLGMLAVVPFVGAVVALLLGCWIAGRLSLVFPGIAVERGVSFGQSWEETEHHQLLMFLVVLVVPVLLALPGLLLHFFPFGHVLTSVFSTLVVVFEVAALSMAYRLIMSTAGGDGFPKA